MRVSAAFLLSLSVFGAALVYIRREKARCEALCSLRTFFERLLVCCAAEKSDTLCIIEKAAAEMPGFYDALTQAYDLSGSLVSAWREAVLAGPFSAVLRQPALSFLADFSEGFESVSEARFLERCREAEAYYSSEEEEVRRRFAQLRQTALSFGILGAILIFIIVV